MEMRRQVTVSWDTGNSDEAPPKVNLLNPACSCTVTHTKIPEICNTLIRSTVSVYVFISLSSGSVLISGFGFHSPVDPDTRVLDPVTDISLVHNMLASTIITR